MENLDLTDFFTTKAQANDFSARLTALSEDIFEVGFNLDRALLEQFGVQKKDKFLSLLRENEIPLDSNSTLSNFLTKIKDSVSQTPVISLSLAIEPDSQILKAIADWFFLNLKHQVLIEFEVDTSLIAGAIVNYQGKSHDASIRTLFDSMSTEILSGNSGNKVISN